MHLAYHTFHYAFLPCPEIAITILISAYKISRRHTSAKLIEMQPKCLSKIHGLHEELGTR